MKHFCMPITLVGQDFIRAPWGPPCDVGGLSWKDWEWLNAWGPQQLRQCHHGLVVGAGEWQQPQRYLRRGHWYVASPHMCGLRVGRISTWLGRGVKQVPPDQAEAVCPFLTQSRMSYNITFRCFVLLASAPRCHSGFTRRSNKDCEKESVNIF